MKSEMQWLSVEPVDSCFFRDGRAMHIGESALLACETMFPPSPLTTGGALRAALARTNGWNSGPHWPASLHPVLGVDEELGSVRFWGPFLSNATGPLFPCPLHILGQQGLAEDDRWKPYAAMQPGAGVLCDLGAKVRLPAVPAQARGQAGLKPGEGYFVTAHGLQDILAGHLPAQEELVSKDSLWTGEYRIGNSLSEATRTTGENALYATRHARVQPGTCLLMATGGLPPDWAMPSGLHPFGGEGRMAEFTPLETPPHFLPEAPDRSAGELLILLTPLVARYEHLVPGGTLPGLEGAEIVCACTGRATRIGGWSFTRHAPLPRRPVYPAGTVIFCQRTERATNLATPFVQLGESTEYGFGLAAVGIWNDHQE